MALANMQTMKQRFLILVATLAVAAVVVPVSFAGSPSKVQYPSAGVMVAKAHHSKKHHTQGQSTLPTVKSSGTLPFTGANLALAAGVAAALAAAGFGLVAVGRRQSGE
jgi:hypothetical protein